MADIRLVLVYPAQFVAMLVPLENIPTKKEWSNKMPVKIAAVGNIKMHLAMTRVWIATLANTWVAWVLWTVWIAIRVIFKTWPERNRARNALKIRSPTSVECHRVMVAKWVKKVILEVPNVPVATPVNQERVLMVRVKNVRRVNLVHPMIKTLLLARHVIPASIKTKLVKHLVYHAYLARMKMLRVRKLVKIVAKENTNIWLATKPVWIVKWASTWMVWVPSIVWIAILVYTRMNLVKWNVNHAIWGSTRKL
jgi:hypothetical protein